MKDDYSDWCKVYDFFYSDLTDDIDFYIRKSNHVKGPILEIGCGTGRVLFPMIHEGREMVGLDSSQSMLNVAKQKMNQSQISPNQCELLIADMKDFDIDRRFQLIIIPFNGFLSLMSIDDQLKTLQNIRKHLIPGGRLLFDVFIPDHELLVQDGDLMVHSRDLKDPITGHTTMIYEQAHADVFNQFVFARILMEQFSASGESLQRLCMDYKLRYIHISEMFHLLDRSSFEILNIFGNFDEDPLSEHSSVMILEVI